MIAWAARQGIDAVGWFPGAPFAHYLRNIAERRQIYDFQYRTYADFLQAGKAASVFPTIIVLVKDYYLENACAATGLKLSNYTRFCWQTIDPKADLLIHYLHEQGHMAEKIDVPARAAACKAGLGFIGKNSLFYSAEFGSFVAICTIGTSLRLEACGDAEERIPCQTCRSCNRCIAACPTGAIEKNGFQINPLKCISFINRHIGETRRIMPDEPGRLGNWLHGCEICQEVCPLNHRITHKRDVLITDHVDLYGMRLANRAVVKWREIQEQFAQIKVPEYKDYLRMLQESNISGIAAPRC